MSGLAITLIVISVLLVVGGGACAMCGGLVLLGASAEGEPAPAQTAATATGAPAIAPPTGDPDPNGDPGGADPSGAPGDPGASGEPTPSPGARAPAAAGGKWFCNATGFVRVCIGTNCMNQMVSGTGLSTDRNTAAQTARTACQGMAIARGGAATCSVACTQK